MKLWSGTKRGSGTLTVNNIHKYDELGFMFQESGSRIIQPIMVESNKISLATALRRGDYSISSIAIDATVSNNSINITKAHIGVIGASGWGQSVVTLAGDSATIIGIYGRCPK